MEIKRRLTKIAKSLSPQIEVMNVASEMERMCKRFEEIIAYAQEKIDRAEERKKKNLPTIGKYVDNQRKAADKVVEDAQSAEVEENLKDQEESWQERNKIEAKTKPIPEQANEEATVDTSGDNPDGAGDVAGGGESPAGAQDDVKPTKKKTKKKASKKKS